MVQFDSYVSWIRINLLFNNVVVVRNGMFASSSSPGFLWTYTVLTL